MSANIAIKSELSVILPIFLAFFVRQAQFFIFFLSPERKPKQKKERENVLSSEAGTIIFQSTQ